MVSQIIFLLFFPACLGILRQVIWNTELTHQLLAFGIFLFCIEQANMANQDLQQVADAKTKVQDARLDIFQRITIITIIIELVGFYLSSIYLGGGSLLILFGLIWFNLFANIKINHSANNIIKPWSITERLPVLIADVIGLILTSLWMLKIGDIWISWGLFVMAVVFCDIKLFLYFKSFNFRWEI
ncbi:hypothetical protein Riv7116_2364 [Rivularia sp. PCC 7116]|uniref:hypothetical protein n=1 Tax=Rivularia sp. PCC 7116 TaxID=373994 RepID=UPI00029EE31E|nr:hypothetical protein [Rivularia sp. PCC 7116]AFY54880.1 hypothetical protein Riv7116_2364 [Rivularia sp. PCC 7116]